MLTFKSATKIYYKIPFSTPTPELLYEPPLFLDETTIYFYLAHFGTQKKLFRTMKEL
jgi:hypothetical protein